jgi:hypothetical protein
MAREILMQAWIMFSALREKVAQGLSALIRGVKAGIAKLKRWVSGPGNG